MEDIASDEYRTRKFTFTGLHDEFYDFKCSLCDGEEKLAEAVKYCEECLVYLCGPCLKNHNKFPLNRRHSLLAQTQFTAALTPELTKRCTQHPEDLVNTYCGKHDVVCCNICKKLEHRKCRDTLPLSSAASGIFNSDKYKIFTAETLALTSQLTQILTTRKADKSRIEKEKQRVKQTIEDFKKTVLEFFDDLERMTLDELDEKEDIIKDGVDFKTEYLEKMKQKADEVSKQIELSNGKSESEVFYNVVTEKAFVIEALEEVRDIIEADESPFIQFDANKDLESYLSSLKSLGSITYGEDIIDCAYPLQTRDLTQVIVNESSDNYTCHIVDICLLPDSTVLVLDNENEKLKRFDSSYNLIDYVNISHSVFNLCYIGQDKVAVSLYLDKKIQLVSMGKKMKLKKKIDVETYGRGMRYIDGKLMVCCGDVSKPSSTSCIKVYSTDRKLLERLPRAPLSLPKVPRYIARSFDGHYLYITSEDSDNVTMLDRSGNILKTLSHEELKRPSGICTDRSGQVFVCGKGNKIIRFSARRKKADVVMGEADGIKAPLGICFDATKSRLLVGCFDSNDLLVLSAK